MRAELVEKLSRGGSRDEVNGWRGALSGINDIEASETTKDALRTAEAQVEATNKLIRLQSEGTGAGRASSAPSFRVPEGAEPN